MGEQLKIDGIDVKNLSSKLASSADDFGTFEVSALDNKTTLTANGSGRGAITLISKSINSSKEAFRCESKKIEKFGEEYKKADEKAKRQNERGKKK
ncbi:TIGR04197 family type VII secretion effector [Lachnobacterium bovis]|uniref:TIGR04197 family type VII secretion effector n=1 Tax=Lachnobacterium bovis TaxID=140626 RepID=UPI0003B5764E|nr:TIGR04197 family type VII secretion effector [Lachnobacterium bovis]